ncbi:unnamed protein product, partial [Amoebophrya sp. A120]|eukprot:GSA120T00011062001.1
MQRLSLSVCAVLLAEIFDLQLYSPHLRPVFALELEALVPGEKSLLAKGSRRRHDRASSEDHGARPPSSSTSLLTRKLKAGSWRAHSTNLESRRSRAEHEQPPPVQASSDEDLAVLGGFASAGVAPPDPAMLDFTSRAGGGRAPPAPAPSDLPSKLASSRPDQPAERVSACCGEETGIESVARVAVLNKNTSSVVDDANVVLSTSAEEDLLNFSTSTPAPLTPPSWAGSGDTDPTTTQTPVLASSKPKPISSSSSSSTTVPPQPATISFEFFLRACGGGNSDSTGALVITVETDTGATWQTQKVFRQAGQQERFRSPVLDGSQLGTLRLSHSGSNGLCMAEVKIDGREAFDGQNFWFDEPCTSSMYEGGPCFSGPAGRVANVVEVQRTTTSAPASTTPGPSGQYIPARCQAAQVRPGTPATAEEYVDGVKGVFMSIADWGWTGYREASSAECQKAIAREAIGYLRDRGMVHLLKFVLAGGDNIYDGILEDRNRFYESFLSRYDTELTCVPWYAVLGNHDMGGQNHKTCWPYPDASNCGQVNGDVEFVRTSKDCTRSRPFGSRETVPDCWAMPKASYSVTAWEEELNLTIIVTDGNELWKNGYPFNTWGHRETAGPLAILRQEGENELRSRLRQPTAKNIVVLNHYPYYGAGDSRRLYQQDLEYAVREQGKSVFFFAGHTHDTNQPKNFNPHWDVQHYIS